MNLYATSVHVPFGPFVNDAHPNDLYKTIINGRVMRHYVDVPITDLNPQLVEWFAQRGLEVFISELFSKLPNPIRLANRIHSGAGGAEDATKINWVWGGAGSVMTWYQKKLPPTAAATGFNSVGSKIVYYTDLEKENAEPIHRHELKYSPATLIQIGCPHAVENPHEERWALTTVYRDSVTKGILTYKDMYDRLIDVIHD